VPKVQDTIIPSGDPEFDAKLQRMLDERIATANQGKTVVSQEEYRLLRQKCTQARNAVRALGHDALPALYGMLDEGAGGENLLTLAASTFTIIDGYNPASEGEREALEWVRKISETDVKNRQNWEFLRSHSSAYLTMKGKDEEDVKRLQEWPRRGGGILTARIAGTNVLHREYSMHAKSEDDYFLRFYPSVTNTGPQAVYVHQILLRYMEQSGQGDAGIPDELLTMVVSFGTDGAPACSVDLTRHGLSMPVITPKPDKHYRGEYTATFPHLAEPPPPPPVAEPSPLQEPAPLPPPADAPPADEPPAENKGAPWRLPLLIGVAIATGSVAAWRYARKNLRKS
jgi:hypothetical protein